jgi:hypothetical protein
MTKWKKVVLSLIGFIAKWYPSWLMLGILVRVILVIAALYAATRDYFWKYRLKYTWAYVAYTELKNIDLPLFSGYSRETWRKALSTNRGE